MLSLDGVTHGNGSFIVPAADGTHFDHIVVNVKVGTRSPASTGSARPAIRLVQDVSAASLVASGSGSIGIAGYACGAIVNWSGSVFKDTWYGAHLEMDLYGWLKHCYYAVTTNLTPYEYGAGSWNYSSGVGGNYTWTSNPWINWYGSLWGCCSDTILERYYMNGAGNFSWQVYN